MKGSWLRWPDRPRAWPVCELHANCGIYVWLRHPAEPKVPHVYLIDGVPLSMLSAATLESVLAQAVEAALLVSEAGIILFANDRACSLFKYSAGELHGQSLELLVPHRNRLAHIGHRLRFTDDRRTRPMSTGLELFALCKDGSERRIDIGLRPVQRGLQNLVIATIQLRETDARMPSADSGAAQDEAPSPEADGADISA